MRFNIIVLQNKVQKYLKQHKQQALKLYLDQALNISKKCSPSQIKYVCLHTKFPRGLW